MLLSEIPLFELIRDAEKKHGINVHMVIELMPKDDSSPENIEEATEDDVIWHVEFEKIKKDFKTFSEVKKFLLEDAVAKKDNFVVKLNPSGT